jgi:hypothetical protein
VTCVLLRSRWTASPVRSTQSSLPLRRRYSVSAVECKFFTSARRAVPSPPPSFTLRARYRAVPSVTPGIPMPLRLRPPGPACLNLSAGFAVLPSASRRSSLQILDKRCPSAKWCSSDCLCNCGWIVVHRRVGGAASRLSGTVSVNAKIEEGLEVTSRKSGGPSDVLGFVRLTPYSPVVHQTILHSFACFCSFYVSPGLFSLTLSATRGYPRVATYTAARFTRPRIRVSATHGSRRRVMRK